MAAAVRVEIPRSSGVRWPQSSFAHEVKADVDVAMTIWLRPRAGGAIDVDRAKQLGATPPSLRRYENRHAFEERTTCDPNDVAVLRAYCAQFDISVDESRWRCVIARGRLSRFIDAFGAQVAVFVDEAQRSFRARSGPLRAPENIAKIVRAVFGFSQWPRARRLGALERHATPLSISEITSRYAFPDADGAGETIAIVQMGGAFRLDDFTACMKAQGVQTSAPLVKRIDDPADGHVNVTAHDLEGALDAQIAAALAPAAHIVIYRGPNGERAFLDAIRAAVFDDECNPSVLSISYGWPESLWTPAAVDILNELFIAAALLGMTVLCASGDNGAELSYDGKPHVLFPASSPFAHACGATAINPGTPKSDEVAWDSSGGGFSEQFEIPEWQAQARAFADVAGVAPGRGVPDVAAQESPGYCVYLKDVELAAGGTSAIAPMWASLAARLNQRIGSRIGFFTPLLYRRSEGVFRDVVAGGNDVYRARSGWNPCTGLGVPVGTALESALRATPA